MKSRGSSVSSVTKLQAGQLGFNPSRGNDRIFSICHYVQTSSMGHPASCPLGLGGPYPGSKADCSPLSSAKVKNAWNCTTTASICLHDMALN
jgi:hypothetical protein